MGAEGLSTLQARQGDMGTLVHQNSSPWREPAVQAPFTVCEGVRNLQIAMSAVHKQGKELQKVTNRIIQKSLKFVFLSGFRKIILACNGQVNSTCLILGAQVCLWL